MASRAVAICDGIGAAIALLGQAGRIERATSGFLDRFDAADGMLPACAGDVELITGGQADRLTVHIDGVEADLAAVVDGDGRRSAVLTVPNGDASETASPLADEPLDDSPAIVWLKDLEGRYLRVNSLYLEQVGADADDVNGLTDVELTAARSIEGMRLENRDPDWHEPLELEYYVGAFEERPAFAVLRFALRDRDGQPTATCSVAAPDGKASLARSECERLMKIDRWGRLDAFAIRQELLEQWELTVADGSSGPPLDRDDRVAAALAERDEARAAVATLEGELLEEREQQNSLRSASELAAGRAKELDGTVAAERTRSAELEEAVARGESRVSELEAELAALRAELEENQASGERATTALGERDEALSSAERLQQELSHERDEAIAKAEQLEQELATARDQAASKAEQLEQELATARDKAGSKAERREAELANERDEALSKAKRVKQELTGERDEAVAKVERLEQELSSGRDEAASDAERLQQELSDARDEAVAKAERLEQELTTARDEAVARAERLEQELAAARDEAVAKAERLERELTTARDEAVAKAERLEQELITAHDEAVTKAERLEQELTTAHDEATAKAERLEQELANEREQREALRAESELAAERAQELDGAVGAERARSAELEQSLGRTETRATELQSELEAARAELDEHREAKPREAAAPAPHSEGPAWGNDAQRALSAALVGQTEWRSMLKRAVDALGSAGGWDATIAWSPDGPHGAMRCGAMWTGDAAKLSRFETRVWQQRKDASTAEFGRARSRMATTCLLELESAEDPLLRAAAQEGMRSALLMPITSGGETIAILELLAATATAPNAELTVSLDAIALQLSAIAQLIKFADAPRWRTGRL